MDSATVPANELPAGVPTEGVQPEGLSLPRARVDDLCEDDAVVTPVKDFEGVALDPPRAATDHRKPRGRPHEPRTEHQVVAAVLRLRPDDVCTVWDLLQDLLLQLLVHQGHLPAHRRRA